MAYPSGSVARKARRASATTVRMPDAERVTEPDRLHGVGKRFQAIGARGGRPLRATCPASAPGRRARSRPAPGRPPARAGAPPAPGRPGRPTRCPPRRQVPTGPRRPRSRRRSRAPAPGSARGRAGRAPSWPVPAVGGWTPRTLRGCRAGAGAGRGSSTQVREPRSRRHRCPRQVHGQGQRRVVADAPTTPRRHRSRRPGRARRRTPRRRPPRCAAAAPRGACTARASGRPSPGVRPWPTSSTTVAGRPAASASGWWNHHSKSWFQCRATHRIASSQQVVASIGLSNRRYSPTSCKPDHQLGAAEQRDERAELRPAGRR